MEPLTVLTAISAASASIKWCKERLQDCEDLGTVAGHVTKLLQSEQALNKDQSSKGSIGISLQTSIDHVIEKRKIRETLADAKLLINMRWGPTCYDEIIAHYNNAQREERERIQEKKREKIRAAARLEKQIETIALSAFIILVIVVMGLFIFAAVNKSGAEEIVL
jgi:hypothetical protein